ncbi:MAG: hypothetical protein IPG68_12345 [Micrococcales bacterium]|nr:hypothetical protein [Micrococcales bacterium]
MSGSRPVSVAPVCVPNATPVPSDVPAGAVAPFARRTITAARSASGGLVQNRLMLSGVRSVAVRALTWPGAVVSGAVIVVGMAVHT